MSEEERLQVERSVDLQAMRWPSREIASGEDGEGINRSYVDLRGCSWRQVQDAIPLEQRILERFDRGEGVAEEGFTDQEAAELFYLDLGVASAVLALSAAHCVPLYSCNGEKGHSEEFPVVIFRARPARVPDLLEAADEAGCGLINVDDGRLMVYAGHVRTMIGFARALLARRNTLRKLNQSRALTSGRHREDPQQLTLPFL
jgi:hypothetical protein